MSESAGPAEIYRQRLSERQQAAAAEQQRHLTIGNLRLFTGIGAAVMGWMVFAQRTISPWWLVLPVVAFGVLAAWHSRVLRRRTIAERAVLFYQRGLARIEDQWTGMGEAGEEFRDAEHPYAEDLDLFGRGSLFELLNSARTHGGEAKLAGWLKNRSAADVIRERQDAVRELRTRLTLREDLFVLGEDARGKLRSDALVRWAETPRILPPLRIAAFVLNALLIAGLAVLNWKGIATPLLLAGAATAGFGYWMRMRVLAVISHADEAVHEIDLLRALLERLEKDTFESGRLRMLAESLRTAGAPPSAQIARLHGLAEWIDSRDNAAVRVIGPPLLMGTHLAFAVENWKAHSGAAVRRWIEAVSEMEALLSLAGYSYEHPADPFPELVDELVLEGEDLGHPLLEATRCVRNPVSLGHGPRLLLISGSNMSGKSTYLRTVGVNAVLAMAGSVVRAKRLRLCPLAIGASIRVSDSLQGGSSRFYAEITRLKQIVDLSAEGKASFFLLDEFLHGTNSHDRKIGAEGVLRELASRNTLGMVTTHDLALTTIADELGPRGANFHFEDHLEDGKLCFDYRLRKGVVSKSNALALMRSIGLEV